MWSTWIPQLHEFKLSEWRNFQQNDPRVARYVLTQQSKSEIRTRIPTKLSSTIIAFPVISQPRSEVNAKRMRSTWILFHARAEKWMCEMRDRKKLLLLSRARTHTTTVTHSTRSWNAPLDWSLAAHKRRNRIGRRCAWVSAVLLLRVWKERVATSVRRPMARCHIPTCDMTSSLAYYVRLF